MYISVCFQVDMTKVNVDTMKPWIANRITELLGLEDDVVVEFVYNQLEERVNTRPSSHFIYCVILYIMSLRI